MLRAERRPCALIFSADVNVTMEIQRFALLVIGAITGKVLSYVCRCQFFSSVFIVTVRLGNNEQIMWNRSAWSLSVVIFRWSCASGHGGGNVITQCGVIVWEMRCSRQPLSNGSVFRWRRCRCHQTREIAAFQAF